MPLLGGRVNTIANEKRNHKSLNSPGKSIPLASRIKENVDVRDPRSTNSTFPAPGVNSLKQKPGPAPVEQRTGNGGAAGKGPTE